MYAGYNQYELKGVRIGNWVDEAALLEATGHNRGPRPGEPDFGIDNPERVIGAPGATHPKDWQSDYQAGFIDHAGRDNYRPMPDHGQREADGGGFHDPAAEAEQHVAFVTAQEAGGRCTQRQEHQHEDQQANHGACSSR